MLCEAAYPVREFLGPVLVMKLRLNFRHVTEELAEYLFWEIVTEIPNFQKG